MKTTIKPNPHRHRKGGRRMIITQENAKPLLGKMLDAEKRRFHYYPLTVFERNGTFYIKDSAGVCYEIPPESDKFNAIRFDFVKEATP